MEKRNLCYGTKPGIQYYILYYKYTEVTRYVMLPHLEGAQ